MLLLNSTYEPLTALPIRRAVVMLMCGKADVVHDDPGGPVIHSATRAIAFSRSGFGTPCISRPKEMFSRTVMCG